jgi:hypothetical protein|tara:strand:+ start:8962 stop:9531 length:570 start_codon:yes stop_codon:yes gene_type:complete
MRQCPLCNITIQVSQNKKQVRCVNKGCTACFLKIDKNKFDAGLLTGFVKFWEVYPRKTSKKNSLKAWVKLSPDTDMFTNIVKSVVAHKFESVQWQNPQYIPYPDTWLRARGWENEILKEEPVKPAPVYNQPIEPYKHPTKAKSTPKSRELAKEMLKLGKELITSKTKEEKDKIKQQIKDKQTEIEKELK